MKNRGLRSRKENLPYLPLKGEAVKETPKNTKHERRFLMQFVTVVFYSVLAKSAEKKNRKHITTITANLLTFVGYASNITEKLSMVK
jgi:hypothetical protein